MKLKTLKPINIILFFFFISFACICLYRFVYEPSDIKYLKNNIKETENHIKNKDYDKVDKIISEEEQINKLSYDNKIDYCTSKIESLLYLHCSYCIGRTSRNSLDDFNSSLNDIYDLFGSDIFDKSYSKAKINHEAYDNQMKALKKEKARLDSK